MNRPIRILHVLTAMNLAGTETLLMNFYRNINRSLVQFDFAVSATQECAYDREIEDLGGHIYHYPSYRGKNHFSYKKWWNDFLEEHPEYHIIHGHIGSTASIYLRIAKNKGRYTIAHSHSTKSAVSAHSIVYRLYSYPTRYIADFFFGCSQQALIDRYGYKVASDENRAKVLNNAIDAKKYTFNIEERKKVRRELSLPEDMLVLGTVGRLTPPKNPHEIIRICENLKKNGLNFVFLWYGTGELKEEIEKEISNKGLNDIIWLCGTRPDIYNVLQAMDIFIFPSVWEGLGIACVEAQAAGLPTLCSDTIPQEARVTDLSLFIKLNDTEKWCEEVYKIASRIQSESYLRPNAYQDILDAGFDIVDLARWLEEFYAEKW